MSKNNMLILIVLLPLLIFPNLVFAHKVGIISWIQDGILYTESEFNSGKKVQNGQIQVCDATGHVISTGKTDPKGCYSVKIEQIEDLKIILSTSCGHKSFSTIDRSEIGYSSYQDKHNTKVKINSELHRVCLTEEQVEHIVSRQLKNKLHPISKAIARSQQNKINFHDVIGGVGYIVGLIGLGAYLRCNKK